MSSEIADPILDVRQSVVDARGAAAVMSTAPNSVFALGAAGAGVVAPPKRGRSKKAIGEHHRARVLELLANGEELNTLTIAEKLGVSGSATGRLMAKMVGEKAVCVSRSQGRLQFFKLPAGGFKGWLRNKGEESAEGRAPRRRPAAAAEPKATRSKPAKRPGKTLPTAVMHAAAPVAPASAVSAPPVIEPSTADELEIALGLFSNGEIQIDVVDNSLRLNRTQTRQLIDWLLKVDAALRP